MYKKNLTMLPIWTKFWNHTLEQRNKENRQKTKLQTTTCAKQETSKKNAKHMQNQELKKN
jgi:hypothetical protein